MGKKSKRPEREKREKPKTRKQVTQSLKRENISLSETSCEVVDKVESLNILLSRFRAEYRKILRIIGKNTTEQRGKDAFKLLEDICNIYQQMDNVIAGYHFKIGQEQEIVVKQNFIAEAKQVWRAQLKPLIEDVSDILPRVLELVQKNEQYLLSYIDQETGDNFFHLLARAHIAYPYLEEYFNISVFQSYYTGKLFAKNKQQETAYSLFLTHIDNPIADYGSYMQIQMDAAGIEILNERKYFKVYQRASEIVSPSQDFSFFTLAHFINRSRADSIRGIVHRLTEGYMSHLFMMSRYSLQLVKAYIKSVCGNQDEYAQVKTQIAGFDISLMPEIAQALSKIYAIGLTMAKEDLSPEEDLSPKERYEQKSSDFEEVYNEFRRNSVGSLINFMSECFGLDSDYKNTYIFTAKNRMSASLIYSNLFTLLSEKSLSYFIGSSPKEITANAKIAYMNVLEAVVSYCAKQNVSLQDVAVGEMSSDQGEMCFYLESLVFHLMRLSKIYKNTYDEKKGKNPLLADQAKVAHEAVIYSFNLFWDKLDPPQKESLLARTDLQDRSIIFAAIEDASLEFRKNLIEKIRQQQEVINIFPALKAAESFLFLLIKQADYDCLGLVLEGNFPLELNASCQEQEESFDLLSLYISSIKDKDVYLENRKLIVNQAMYLKHIMTDCNQDKIDGILAEKDLLDTSLARLLGCKQASEKSLFSLIKQVDHRRLELILADNLPLYLNTSCQEQEESFDLLSLYVSSIKDKDVYLENRKLIVNQAMYLKQRMTDYNQDKIDDIVAEKDLLDTSLARMLGCKQAKEIEYPGSFSERIAAKEITSFAEYCAHNNAATSRW